MSAACLRSHWNARSSPGWSKPASASTSAAPIAPCARSTAAEKYDSPSSGTPSMNVTRRRSWVAPARRRRRDDQRAIERRHRDGDRERQPGGREVRETRVLRLELRPRDPVPRDLEDEPARPRPRRGSSGPGGCRARARRRVLPHPASSSRAASSMSTSGRRCARPRNGFAMAQSVPPATVPRSPVPPPRPSPPRHPACIDPMHTLRHPHQEEPVSVGTAFHPRTAPLNRKMQWREWAGFYASSVYADFHDIEYNAIREAAAVIDVSPLYKYRIKGSDAIALADRVITRDATKLKVGQVYYTPWCDEHGKVIDDGTVHRVGEHELRWTAADPQIRWLTQNAAGPERDDRRRDRGGRGARAPGPVQPRRARGRERRRLLGPALLPPPRDEDRRQDRRRQPDRLHRRPRLRAVDRRRRTPVSCGTPCSRRARRTRSGPRACSRSTSRGSRPG